VIDDHFVPPMSCAVMGLERKFVPKFFPGNQYSNIYSREIVISLKLS